MFLINISNVAAFYALCCLLGSFSCFHYTSAVPLSNGQRTEKLYADFSDVPGTGPDLISGVLPLPVYKHLKYTPFNLGASPLGGSGPINIFPINGTAPYAIARFILADLLTPLPTITASYEGSDINKFSLHSLNFHCSTTMAGPVPMSLLIDCTLKFTSYLPSSNGGKGAQGGSMEVRFVPLPGGETPIIQVRKSPQAFANFGNELEGAGTVEIEYVRASTIGLIGGIPIPANLVFIALDNLNYTVFYK
ncbi:hypothetical protein TWF506_000422 [Arthrobotrys conoides]|uniref:Uncharacterized protein n=1 Tax=Arthrobotrys conoides TaxID=74498 RepID=A0AAN8PQR1_9PEZI